MEIESDCGVCEELRVLVAVLGDVRDALQAHPDAANLASVAEDVAYVRNKLITQL